MNLVALKKCMVYVTFTFTAWILPPRLINVKENKVKAKVMHDFNNLIINTVDSR